MKKFDNMKERLLKSQQENKTSVKREGIILKQMININQNVIPNLMKITVLLI